MITINIYDFDQDNFIGTNDIEQAVKLLTQVAINMFPINIKIFPININIFPIDININIFPQFQFRIIEIIEYQKGQ